MYIGPGQRFNFATKLPPPENIGMFPLLLSSYSVMSDVLQSHGLQASLSFAVSQSLCKLMSIESVMPSNHLVLVIPFSSCFQSSPASGSFLMSQLFASGGQSTAASASALVLPMNIQDLFPLGLTGLIL